MKRCSLFSCLGAAIMFVLCAPAPPTYRPIPTAPAIDVTNAYQDREVSTISVLRASPTGFKRINTITENYGAYSFAIDHTGPFGSRCRA